MHADGQRKDGSVCRGLLKSESEAFEDRMCAQSNQQNERSHALRAACLGLRSSTEEFSVDAAVRLHGLGDFAVDRLLQSVHDVLRMSLVADKLFLDCILKQLLLRMNLIGIDRLTQLGDGAAKRLASLGKSAALVLSQFHLPKDDLVDRKDETIATDKQ